MCRYSVHNDTQLDKNIYDVTNANLIRKVTIVTEVSVLLFHFHVRVNEFSFSLNRFVLVHTNSDQADCV